MAGCEGCARVGRVLDAVTHLWCLYHLEDPLVAIGEAWRVLQNGGRYDAATAARDSDPELLVKQVIRRPHAGDPRPDDQHVEVLGGCLRRAVSYLGC